MGFCVSSLSFLLVLLTLSGTPFLQSLVCQSAAAFSHSPALHFSFWSTSWQCFYFFFQLLYILERNVVILSIGGWSENSIHVMSSLFHWITHKLVYVKNAGCHSCTIIMGRKRWKTWNIKILCSNTERCFWFWRSKSQHWLDLMILIQAQRIGGHKFQSNISWYFSWYY